MGNIVERAKQQKRVSVENRSKRQLDLKIAPDPEDSRETIIEKSTKFKRIKL